MLTIHVQVVKTQISSSNYDVTPQFITLFRKDVSFLLHFSLLFIAFEDIALQYSIASTSIC